MQVAAVLLSLIIAGGQQEVRPDADTAYRTLLNDLSLTDHGLLAVGRPEIVEALRLTVEQKAKVEAELRQWAVVSARAGEALRKAVTDEREFPANGASRAEIAQSKSEAERAKQLLKETRPRVLKNLESILTAEQKAAFDKLLPRPAKELTRLTLDSVNQKIAFSPDGKFLAVGAGGKVVLHFLDEKREPIVLQVKSGQVAAPKRIQNHLSFSGDGKRVAHAWADEAAGKGYEMVVWDVSKKAEMVRSVLQVEARFDYDPFTFTSDLSRVAVVALNSFRVLDTGTGAEVAEVKCGDGEFSVSDLAFSEDGKLIVASGSLGIRTGEVQIWDTATWKQQKVIRDAWGARLSTDSKSIVYRTKAGNEILDLTSSKKEAVPAPLGIGNDCGRFFIRSGKDLVFVTISGEIAFWSIEERRQRAFYKPTKLSSLPPAKRHMALTPDGRRLAILVQEKGLLVAWSMSDDTSP